MSINKKIRFVCQISDAAVKVVKCALGSGPQGKAQILAAGVEPLSAEMDEKKIGEKTLAVLKKLEYKNNRIILSLPHNFAACRLLKVPSQSDEEIEKIINLQASRYLPYPANELITGYQVVKQDQEGFSLVNLVIVHKDVIERYLRILAALRSEKLSIVLSSYGLCYFYNFFKSDQPLPAMLVDMDADQVELAVVSSAKLLFSRSFKLNQSESSWKEYLVDEVRKTYDTYLKEAEKQDPEAMIVLGNKKTAQECAGALSKKVPFPVEMLPYPVSLEKNTEVSKVIADARNSFVTLIGLGLQSIPESLNLLPRSVKEESQRRATRTQYIQRGSAVVGIILVIFFAVHTYLIDKKAYLGRLKSEINNLAVEARPLEDIVMKSKIFETQKDSRRVLLDLLYELHQVISDQISLLTLNYDSQEGTLILRGQSTELNALFDFVARLENAPELNAYATKIRYATRKKIQRGEIIDFEVGCVKKR